MNPEGAVIELLGRVGAQSGAATLISDYELNGWPAEAVKAMKNSGLLEKSRPATSATCPGCERECVMPVRILAGAGHMDAFIVCDKRSDINRVPVAFDRLEQWQTSGDSIANFLAHLLHLSRSGGGGASNGRWEIGLFKGAKHASHLVLLASDHLALTLAGHSIALSEVLTLEGNAFKVDKRALIRLVDHPVAGAGDTESAAKRRERLKKRVQAVKAKGTRAFLKTVAEEEGISISRLKQLLKDNPAPAKSSLNW